MKKVLIFIMIMAVLLATVFTGCSSSGKGSKDADTIKIGVASPYTGDYAQFGDYTKDGVELAVEEINNAGGVLGKPIEIVYGDDKGDSKEAVSVAQKFASDKNIVGIIGHFFSGASLAAGPIYQQNEIPAIAVASTNPNVANIGNYVYRINVGDNYQGSQLAELLKAEGYNKVSVIYDNSDYGKGVSDVFSNIFKAVGGEVLFNETYLGGQDKDFSLILTKIKNSDTEVIVLVSYYTEASLIIQQARNLGIDVPFYASDSLYTDDFLKLAGDDANGTHVVCYFHESDPSEAAQEFVKKFENKYNKKVDSWSPYAYDAMHVMADAINRAGTTDGPAIRDAIAATADFQGATGVTNFQGAREPVGKDLVILVVEDGQYVVEK
ncbi:ABC transporter substrate-binding protein [Sedimentibacter sp.]|uniref:ABC transporter substrate-binding protein n=1 Tax=Sedimentibacter sp. TaxID=1960295 RepID=UPI0028AA36EC|nr:ABC transporter substrate-binding protein [Sedimentibacter sp.]